MCVFLLLCIYVVTSGGVSVNNCQACYVANWLLSKKTMLLQSVWLQCFVNYHFDNSHLNGSLVAAQQT